MAGAYYNEFDPFKAAWLRELIKAGLIADGEVDERSISDIKPDELRGFSQCHFFAGIGVWSYALRLAGWPDDRPVWTGSCPCPSFSAAGKGKGFNDPRHLWPAWFGLICECRPAAVFGEQVDAAIGYGWLDLVQSDLEAEKYAVGKAVLGACSVGAPHIRKRLYFVAESADSRRAQAWQHDGRPSPLPARSEQRGRSGPTGDMGDPGLQRPAERQVIAAWPEQSGEAGDMEHAEQPRLEGHAGNERDGHQPGWLGAQQTGHAAETGFTRGFWRDAEWIWCRDGKYRPTKPGLSPLAHGTTARVGRLRGYGDAIVAQAAEAFIEAYMATEMEAHCR